MTGRHWRTRALAGVVCLSALALAACGDDSADAGDGGVATLAPSDDPDTSDTGDTGDTGDTVADSEAPTDPDEAFELFNDCMSELGFDIEAGAAGSDSGQVVVAGESGGLDAEEGPVIMGPGGVRIDPEDAEEFEAANEECAIHLANVEDQFEMSPEQQAAMEDAMLRVQECMQEKGFDVQMSISTGSGPGLETHEAPEGDDGPPRGEPINPDDIDREALDAATRECNQIFSEYDELDDFPVPGA